VDSEWIQQLPGREELLAPARLHLPPFVNTRKIRSEAGGWSPGQGDAGEATVCHWHVRDLEIKSSFAVLTSGSLINSLRFSLSLSKT